MKSAAPSRILIFRVGSIGDIVVSLPCFHLIRRRYPRAQIALLTDRPAGRAAPAQSVLDGSGLVDEYICYPGGTRRPRELLALRNRIHAFAPERLIYLAPPRGILSAARDNLFFRWCGISSVVGLPHDVWPRATVAEPEAQRLARHLRELGDAEVERPESWCLRLSAAEIAEADAILRAGLPVDRPGTPRYLGISIGTKQPINDWGDGNWRAVLAGLAHLDVGLVLVGDADDRKRSDELAHAWPGHILNLCGKLSPRMSAAVLRNAMLFLCHDSGPMHLAAAVRTRCVAVFSRQNPMGKWYPFGAGHKIFYPRGAGIRSITPPEVIHATMELLRA